MSVRKERNTQADAERQREQKALAHTIATAMTAESSSDERDDPSVWVRADRRVRFWTDGFAVGTKTFILELHASLKPAEDSVPEFAAGGEDQQADSFYCLQRARKKNRTVTAVPAIPSSPPSG